MNWSVAEICALATKAARGAGAPAAQAERFGRAACLHLMNERDADALAAALDALPGGPILAIPRAIDGALARLGQSNLCTLGPLAQDDLLRSYVEALPFAAHLESGRDDELVLCVDVTQPQPKTMPRRISRCQELLCHMQKLAERTFVPDSDTSRQSGAGAGTSDND
jgi:hypothetical protein